MNSRELYCMLLSDYRIINLGALTLLVYVAVSIPEVAAERSPTFTNVLGRLSKLISHYAHNVDGVNVDGLYGFLIAQGKLTALVHCYVLR